MKRNTSVFKVGAIKIDALSCGALLSSCHSLSVVGQTTARDNLWKCGSDPHHHAYLLLKESEWELLRASVWILVNIGC